MKKEDGPYYMLLIVCILLLICYIGSINRRGKLEIQLLQKPIIDLPEEYKAISNKKLFPDTMLSYQSNDTIYFYFNNR